MQSQVSSQRGAEGDTMQKTRRPVENEAIFGVLKAGEGARIQGVQLSGK